MVWVNLLKYRTMQKSIR